MDGGVPGEAGGWADRSLRGPGVGLFSDLGDVNRVLTVEIKKLWVDTRNILEVEPKDLWKN